MTIDEVNTGNQRGTTCLIEYTAEKNAKEKRKKSTQHHRGIHLRHHARCDRDTDGSHRSVLRVPANLRRAVDVISGAWGRQVSARWECATVRGHDMQCGKRHVTRHKHACTTEDKEKCCVAQHTAERVRTHAPHTLAQVGRWRAVVEEHCGGCTTHGRRHMRICQSACSS
jgi:hypothetical protein